jgi:tRNA pseudouridine32 synthase / 23S rRNA pseudouridine746 synthase
VIGPPPFDLVFADSALLVLNKPSGQLCVPGRGLDKQDCLSARVQRRYPDALTVHRLDQATSGLAVMARGAAMQRSLSQAFAARGVEKRYVAVVDGRIAPTSPQDWQLIDFPLAADWPNRPKQRVDAARGRPSQSNYRVISYDPATDSTRLELAPLTGRTHQLRVHLQAIGHAILGDQLYATATVQAKADRMLLHASRLCLQHPVTGEPMTWSREPLF